MQNKRREDGQVVIEKEDGQVVIEKEDGQVVIEKDVEGKWREHEKDTQK